MVFVKLRKNESTQQLINRFLKRVAQEGLLDAMRDRSAYRKPSQLRQQQIKEKKKKIKRYLRQKHD